MAENCSLYFSETLASDTPVERMDSCGTGSGLICMEFKVEGILEVLFHHFTNEKKETRGKVACVCAVVLAPSSR